VGRDEIALPTQEYSNSVSQGNRTSKSANRDSSNSRGQSYSSSSDKRTPQYEKAKGGYGAFVKCMMFNAQSIRSKFDEFKCYVAEEEPDFVCITEAWVSEGYFGDNLQDYEIQGYNMFSCNRGPAMKGGGVMLYMNSLFSSQKVAGGDKNVSVESIWLDVTVGKGNSNTLRIGAFYRSGTLPHSQQLELDKVICEEISRNFKRKCLILGDFNLKGYENAGVGSPSCKMFRKCLEEDLFLHQFVSEPTRHGSFLDLVFSDLSDLVQDLTVGETLGKSDHNIVRFKAHVGEIIKDNLVKVPNFNRADFNGMRAALSAIRWEEEFSNLNACEMWEKFKSYLKETQIRHVPQKQRRKRRVGKPAWLTPDVIKAIKAKKTAFRVFKEASNVVNLKAYRKARDTVKQKTRAAKRAKELDLASNCNGDSKKFFSFYKLSKVSSTIGPLEVNGTTLGEDSEMVEELSKQFKSVFTLEDMTNLPTIHHSSVTWDLTNDVDFIDSDVVYNHIRKIKQNKAAGPDEIYARVLRETEKELAFPLSIIFCRSVSHNEIPTDWKRANVVPIFKKGERGKVENYRPISLTSLVCKVLESIIKDRIVSYLEGSRLIQNTQHGFRKGRSCLTNLLDFLNFATEQFDQGNQVDVAYLDFSKAFDKVPHKRLMIQLQSHGIAGSILKWIELWLSDRQQRVMLNGTKSSWQNVLSGVPQGSVLGPLLFIIFVNNIESGLSSKVLKFADDLKVFRAITGQDEHISLQKDLDELVKWSEEWQMKFNFDKCKIMHVGKQHMKAPYLMGGQVLSVTQQEKDLGVILNTKLGASEQTKEARKKALRMLGAINRNVSYRSEEVIRKLYCAYVRPHLEYCIQAWSPSYEKDCWLLERVQKRATKMVNGISNLAYEERLKKLNMFSLRYRRLRGDLIEVFKFVNGLERGYLGEMFEFNRNDAIRGHKFKIKVNHSRTRLRQTFFTNRVVEHWNQLPENIVSSSTLNIFKNSIDNHYKNRGLAFQYYREG